jgi:hypothetical protein
VKIADPAAFHAAILTYRMLPAPFPAVIAVWLPWIELLCGLALLTRSHRRGGLWLVITMNVVFIAAIGQAAVRGLDIVCGCFGKPASVRGYGYIQYLVRDLLLAGAAAWLLWRDKLETTIRKRQQAAVELP